MATATRTAMVQPPRPPAGPPPTKTNHSHRSAPPPPKGPPPPPPPKRTTVKRPPPPPPQHVAKRPKTGQNPPPPPPSQRRPGALAATSNAPISKKVAIQRPRTLRDVTAFNKKHQLGKGTYGDVFMGADQKTGQIVALKKINTQQEANYGFPITTVREVKILKALKHENIVKLTEIVTSKEHSEIPKSVFLVFEYHEYDLTGILGTREIRLTQDHIKSWTMQLLRGLNYCHVNKIIHRDLKASNILIGQNGQLKIADWGLARSWNENMKNLTNPVITLWYRPPELLLGTKKYSPKVDMWSVGCIIAEMFRRCGFLTGHNDAAQTELIFKTLGHPTVQDWPDINEMCPKWSTMEPKTPEATHKSRLRETLRSQIANPAWMTDSAIDLIQNLLEFNPAKRWSANDAIAKADYLYEKPSFREADKLCMKFGVDAAHEMSLPAKKNAVARQARQMNGGPARAGKNGSKPPPPPP